MGDINLDNKEATLILPHSITQPKFNIFFNLNNNNSNLVEIKKITNTEIVIPTGVNINIEPLLPIFNKDNYYLEILKLNPLLVIEQIEINVIFVKPMATIRGVQNPQLFLIFQNALKNTSFWELNGICQFGVFGSDVSRFGVFIGSFLIPDFFFLTNEQFSSRSTNQLANESYHSPPYFLMENRSSGWADRTQYENKMYNWVVSGCEIAILVDSIDNNCTVYSMDRGGNSLFPHHNQIQHLGNSFRVHTYNWNLNNNNNSRPPPLNIQLAGVLNQLVLDFGILTLPSINNIIIPPREQLHPHHQMILDSIEILKHHLAQIQTPFYRQTENSIYSLLDYLREVLLTNDLNPHQITQRIRHEVQLLQQQTANLNLDINNILNSHNNSIANIQNITNQNN